MVKKIVCKTMVVDGTKYSTQLTEKYKLRKKYQKPIPGVLRAFIPGTILEVNVEKGQVVKEGEVLLILEAMKMRNKVTAPFDGFVKKLNVSEKQIVAKNELLLEIEPTVKEEEVVDEETEEEVMGNEDE